MSFLRYSQIFFLEDDILVTDTGIPQICPLGSAYLDTYEYVRSKHDINVRWNAPEVFGETINSSAAIWSFGMTIYVR